MPQELMSIEQVKKALRKGGRMVKKQNEAAFTKQVLDYAKLRGWRTAHFRPGRTKDGGWRTAVSGDGVGFPDLILIRGDTLLVVELKVGKNKPSQEQTDWLMAFLRLPGRVYAYVWTPNDWAYIEAELA